MKKITLLILAISFQLQAQSLEDVVNASNKFLESLDNEQLKTAQFTFENKDRTRAGQISPLALNQEMVSELGIFLPVPKLLSIDF